LTKVSDDQRAQSRTISLCGNEWKKVEEISKLLGLGITDFLRSCLELGIEKYATGDNAANNFNAETLAVVLRGLKDAKAFVYKHRDSPKDCQKLYRLVDELYRFLQSVLAKENRPLTEKQKRMKELSEVVKRRAMESGSASTSETDSESEVTLSI
jgi:hypothetical protein